jgi:hypothetical protein
LKDDEKWFDTTHSLHREGNKVTKRCVVCYSRGKRSESVWQCKQCGVALHIEVFFRSTTLNNHFTTPVLVSLNFQYYTRKIPEKNLYWLIFYYFLDVTMPPIEILGDLNLIT